MLTANVTMRLDADLMKRVDEIAERLGETRTHVVERAIKLGLPETERFLKALEHPVAGRALELLMQPGVYSTLAKLAGEKLTPEDLAESRAASEKVKRARSGRGRGATKDK